MLNSIEKSYLDALGRAMRDCNDGLALALFNEYRDYQQNFKESA